MNKSDSRLTIGRSMVVSAVIFAVFLGYVIFLRYAVEPLPAAQETERTTRSFEMLSVVLGWRPALPRHVRLPRRIAPVRTLEDGTVQGGRVTHIVEN